MEQTEADLIAAVRELARTKLVERAARHDREGAFVADNVAELQALGVTGMFVEKAFGGLEVSTETQTRIVEEVAYGCGSTAVALNMHLFTALALQGMPPLPFREPILREVAKGALMCGPVSIPSGEVDNRGSGLVFRDEGDTFVVNGRVGFASMSEGATYVFATGTIPHEGGEPDFVIAFPRLDAPGLRNLKNWDAMGFRATASHDLAFEEVRIPKSEGFAIPLAMLRALGAAGAGQSGMALTRAKGVLGILAIWQGLAQAAFDFTVDYVQKRHGMVAGESTLFGSIGYRAAEPWAQMGLGEMEHWVSTGRILLYDMARRCDEAAKGDQQAFNREMVRVVYHLRRMSEEVSAGAMRTCGAHAYVRSRSLERIFRDMVGSNVMAWKTDQLRQTLGQAALGMPIAIGGPAPA